jgi:hypothetical protein
MMYSDYDSWSKNFLFKIIDESHRLLGDNGYLIFSITDCGGIKITDHVKEFINKKFKIENILSMISLYDEIFEEPIFVLKK